MELDTHTLDMNEDEEFEIYIDAISKGLERVSFGNVFRVYEVTTAYEAIASAMFRFLLRQNQSPRWKARVAELLEAEVERVPRLAERDAFVIVQHMTAQLALAAENSIEHGELMAEVNAWRAEYPDLETWPLRQHEALEQCKENGIKGLLH
jgi:hypothetical protein